MTIRADSQAPFTPAIGMVDRLDSRGFGPSPDEIAGVRAYLAPGDMDPAPLLRLAGPEQMQAREVRAAERRTRDWPALGQYRDANAALAGRPVDVVFIGDSLTEIWGLAQPDLFQEPIVNRGISGQTSPQILLRFMADVVALKPRVVHLMCGLNDIAGNTGPTTPADYADTMLAMVLLAKAHGIATILGSLTPVSSVWRPAVPDPGARILELNRILARLARDHALIHADYILALSDEHGHLRADYHRDGLHPGSAGYRAMRPIADAAIAKALG